MIPGVPAELLDAIQKLGASGGILFAILWWQERSERRAIQEELKACLEENKTIAKEATDAMATIKTTLDMIARIFMSAGPK